MGEFINVLVSKGKSNLIPEKEGQAEMPVHEFLEKC